MRHKTIIALAAALAIVAASAAPAFAAGTTGSPSFVLVANNGYQRVDGGIGSTPTAPYGAYPATSAPGAKALTATPAGLWIAPAATQTDQSTWRAAYCLQLTVDADFFDPYKQIATSSSKVPNLGYIARVVSLGAPNGTEPAIGSIPAVLYDGHPLGEPSYAFEIQEAVVQLAIWYFSDGYVVNTAAGEPHADKNTAIQPLVAQLVNDAIAAGPVSVPGPASVALTPKHIGVETGGIAGPFTLTSSTGTAVVTSSHTTLYSDKAGTTPIASGTSLPSGTQIYASASKNGRITATINSTVPAGAVFTFDGAHPQSTQSLLVGAPASLPAEAVATVTLASSSSPSSSSPSGLALTGVDGDAAVREFGFAVALLMVGAVVLVVTVRRRRRKSSPR